MSESDEITIFEDPNRLELDITSISNSNIIMDDYDSIDRIYNEMSEDYYSKININILRLFAEYYGLSRKGKKVDLIQNIIDYESDPTNKVIVDGCKKMWLNFNELKNNKVFAKYILSI
tara:strand:+ start:1016 stop:1369 length:354 start_codon:yes stop_codon:yes gene_type:complete